MTERIGYNPYFYNYPQYSSNNLGVNNRFSPNFRGEGVGVASSQTSVNYTIPPDTVEISAGNKINEASTQKKQKTGMSTGAKIGLGILGTAATVYGCVVGHRMINKPSIEKVAKNFSEIFRREIGTDEAQKIVKNYKELLKIENPEEFCKKAYEQIKKDYGYKDLGIKFKLEYLPDERKNLVGQGITFGAWSQDEGIMRVLVPICKEKGKQTISKQDKLQSIKTIIHEFQHVKQSEYSYRTSPDAMINAMIEKQNNTTGEEAYTQIIKEFEGLLKNNAELAKHAKQQGMTSEELRKKTEEGLKNLKENKDKIINSQTRKITKEDLKEERKILDSLFKDYPKFAKNSDNYNLGLKYIDNNAHYINWVENQEGYLAQILEKEAFATGDKFKEIYNYFANPWRIF